MNERGDLHGIEVFLGDSGGYGVFWRCHYTFARGGGDVVIWLGQLCGRRTSSIGSFSVVVDLRRYFHGSADERFSYRDSFKTMSFFPVCKFYLTSLHCGPWFFVMRTGVRSSCRTPVGSLGQVSAAVFSAFLSIGLSSTDVDIRPASGSGGFSISSDVRGTFSLFFSVLEGPSSSQCVRDVSSSRDSPSGFGGLFILASMEIALRAIFQKGVLERGNALASPLFSVSVCFNTGSVPGS